MTSNIAIIRLTDDQIDDAARILARAFQDDPLFQYAFPEPERRARLLPWLFGVEAGYVQRYGVALVPAGSLDGVALWFPPGVTLVDERLVEFGADQAPEIFGSESFERLFGVAGYIDAQHEAQLPDRVWLCPTIGVSPDRQSGGIGSALLNEIHQRADHDSLPCALWTTQPRAVPFYQRHGYEVVCDGAEPESGVQFWGFVRQPVRYLLDFPPHAT